ncbi:ArsR/SmtB family transcription factor [Streptomyces dysideae]|uniref:ArsR/SmtB family transcription factor n=1 Tax=Streptomyces dysideae TaxID=909626 RepID=UPI000A95FA5A|nr:metalloregulator ArsR/SmtB family transcription factor [Streptomyces dysideae]
MLALLTGGAVGDDVEVSGGIRDGEVKRNQSLGFRQPTVSHHLKVMTEAGLLNRERRGTWSWYSVNYDGLNRVRAILDPPSAISRWRPPARCSPQRSSKAPVKPCVCMDSCAAKGAAFRGAAPFTA